MRYDGTAITGNVTRQLVGNISIERKPDSGLRTLNARGTFGGGTLYFEISHDGTNFETITDPLTGTTKNFTATGSINVFVGAPISGSGQFLGVYVTLSGSTSPSIIPSIADTRG